MGLREAGAYSGGACVTIPACSCAVATACSASRMRVVAAVLAAEATAAAAAREARTTTSALLSPATAEVTGVAATTRDSVCATTTRLVRALTLRDMWRVSGSSPRACCVTPTCEQSLERDEGTRLCVHSLGPWALDSSVGWRMKTKRQRDIDQMKRHTTKATNQGPLLAIPVLLPQGSSTQGLAARPPEARPALPHQQAPLWMFLCQRPVVPTALLSPLQTAPGALSCA